MSDVANCLTTPSSEKLFSPEQTVCSIVQKHFKKVSILHFFRSLDQSTRGDKWSQGPHEVDILISWIFAMGKSLLHSPMRA